ncbi:hypothetical protein VNO78_05059 [Psophocarpus tetragonolobus]|uniref:Uncharacterized protein n=1 Tax=Psophocarpus tetragonolobus TaxID=3891 RepID=A0AAN9XR78_PSOTE
MACIGVSSHSQGVILCSLCKRDCYVAYVDCECHMHPACLCHGGSERLVDAAIAQLKKFHFTIPFGIEPQYLLCPISIAVSIAHVLCHRPEGNLCSCAVMLSIMDSLLVHSLGHAGEKRKEEETIKLEGPLGKSGAFNHELVSLETELSTLCKNSKVDAFGLYLYGLVLKQKGNENLARTVLVESVNSYPWNWNAWIELQSLSKKVDILNSLNLNSRWMKDFSLASVYQELSAQIAKARYSLREFDQVEAIFEEPLKNDPYRVEDMDVYSNVLYAKECFSSLSHLAHRVFMTDKYRPESFCIIGNYYSLKGQHEKSIVYFRRALKLDKNCLTAWTLMDHEFVEMKNTPAAVDAYRPAVDIDPCHRAIIMLGMD